MRKQLIALLAIALAVATSACQSGDDQQDTGASGDQGSKLTGTVLARVNGEPITEAMLQRHVDQRTGGRGGELNAEMKRNLLTELVDMTLMAQAAKDRGYADKPEVQARLQSVRRAVLAQAMVQAMDPQNSVTDKELQAAYEEQYKTDGTKEYHARHILVDEEAKAKKLIKQLKEGADFAELAREHSTGPTGEKGGDLGWFTADQMVPPFAEAIKALDKGEVGAEPVKTRFGWHVIKLLDTRVAQPPALSQVREQLLSQLARQKIEDTLNELRDKAEVTYTDNAPEGVGEAAGETTEQGGGDSQANAGDADTAMEETVEESSQN